MDAMHPYYPPKEECPLHNLFPGVDARTCWLDKVMLSYVELQPHSIVTEHHHPHEQMGFILQGKALFIINGQERILEPGDWYRVPGNVRHKVVALDELVKVLDVFSPPREEYK